MARTKLSLERVANAEEWDALVRRSPQGTLFSETCFLQATGRKHHLWFIRQGTAIKAGVALVVSDDEKHCVLDDLIIYGGILFDLDPSRQLVKRRHDEFQIAEFVADKLAERYLSIAFSLSPHFEDLRPFQWYRYHEATGCKYNVQLRYTSFLDISCLRDFAGSEEDSPIFAQMETVRRYSVREAQRKGGQVIEAASGEELLNFYSRLMERQGHTQSPAKHDSMRRVMAILMEAARGKVFHVIDATGTILYAVMYGWDAKRAYYLFGAGHPDVSTPWQGTAVHWRAFIYLAQQTGLTEIDLEGVNSPQRGWFKLGFGGDLRPYYHVRKAAAPLPG